MRENFKHHEIKSLEFLEKKFLVAVGHIAVERATRTGYLPNINSHYVFDEETSDDWQLKVTDNGIEVYVPMGLK